MAGSSNSRGHWDVGKSAKKPRKEDADDHFSSLPGSPARTGLVLPPQSLRNVPSGAQELRSHRLSIAQTAAIDGIIAQPPEHPANVTDAANAFNQLRVRTALERNAEETSPSISGADHPPSPKKRKAAGSLQEDSLSTQQRSGNDQQDTAAAPSGPLGEIIQVFGQIELNKDFYEAIAQTESCAGEAPKSNTRAEVDRAAFQAAVQAATTVLRNQVKDLADKGQEASPEFLQAYALNAINIFANQAESSYSGEDLGGEDYFTSSSVERPNSTSLQGLQPRDYNEINSNRNPERNAKKKQHQGGGGGDEEDQVGNEIEVLERTASAMVLHSPTTRSNATPTTTQNNRTPTASGILSENGNSSFDPELVDTAGMVEDIDDEDADAVAGNGGGRDHVEGTPGRNLLGMRQERDAGMLQQQQQQQQQRDENENENVDGEGVLLPPQTPGEPSRPGNDATDDEDHDENLNHGNFNQNINNENRRRGDDDEDLVFSGDGEIIEIEQNQDQIDEESRRRGGDDAEEEEEHAALVREMSILEAGDADYGPHETQENEDQGAYENNGQDFLIPEEEESPPSRDENENRFFNPTLQYNTATTAAAAGIGAVENRGGIFRSPINNGRVLIGLTASPAGGVPLHQGLTSPPSAPLAAQQTSPVRVPQRPQANAGHREKRDPRPTSSGGPSRLSNDPPKRQRKGPGLVVGSAPQRERPVGGIHAELFSSIGGQILPPGSNALNPATGTGTGNSIPTTAGGGGAVLPLGDGDSPAVSRGSIGGRSPSPIKKKAAYSGKVFGKNEEDNFNKKKKKSSFRGGEDDDGSGAAGGGRKEGTKNNSKNDVSPVVDGGAPRGKKRDAAVVVREGASLSISLETAPPEGGGGRGAWGSSLVCADLTLHEVASQFWPSFKKAGNINLAPAGGGIITGGNADGTGKNGNGMNTQGTKELSLAEQEMVQELTAALGAAILGAVSDQQSGGATSQGGGRKLNAKVKSIAAASAFDELWKEREQRHLLEMQEEKEKQEGGVAVVVAESEDDRIK